MDFLALLPAWMTSPEAGLTGLFLASFLAATLLPGGSEAVLLALLIARPELLWPALALATLGNTLGGMTTYAMGRLLPEKVPPSASNESGFAKDSSADVRRSVVGAGDTPKYLAPLRRFGSPALLLAWTPVVGDALCAAAGWLRLNWLPCALWMAAGKAARYGFVAWGALSG